MAAVICDMFTNLASVSVASLTNILSVATTVIAVPSLPAKITL